MRCGRTPPARIVADIPQRNRRMARKCAEHLVDPAHARLEHQRVGVEVPRPARLRDRVIDRANAAAARIDIDGVWRAASRSRPESAGTAPGSPAATAPTRCEKALEVAQPCRARRAPGVGMNASQSRCVRTVRCPAEPMARSSPAVRAASYSCHTYGPTSRDQYVTPMSTGSRGRHARLRGFSRRRGRCLPRR